MFCTGTLTSISERYCFIAAIMAASQRITVDFRFQCPLGCMVVGPTMSGKTDFVLQLIAEAGSQFNPPPNRIVYAYGAWQDVFKRIKNVEFVEGLDGLKNIVFSRHQNNLLILDDLMSEVAKDEDSSTLFTRDMHHRNVSVIFIAQNLYKQGKSMRDIALNCQVFILFKSPRDVHQIKVLGRQMGIEHLEKAYQKAVEKKFGYLVINMQPRTADEYRLQSDIFYHRRVFTVEKNGKVQVQYVVTPGEMQAYQETFNPPRRPNFAQICRDILNNRDLDELEKAELIKQQLNLDIMRQAQSHGYPRSEQRDTNRPEQDIAYVHHQRLQSPVPSEYHSVPIERGLSVITEDRSPTPSPTPYDEGWRAETPRRSDTPHGQDRGNKKHPMFTKHRRHVP